MAVLAYQLRVGLRTRWRHLIIIALLVSLAGGATLGALAAARRTSSAFARMRHATHAWDLLINPGNGDQSRLTVAELRRLPGVAAVARVDGVAVVPQRVTSLDEFFSSGPPLASDGRAGYSVGAPVVVAGHEPAATDADGVWLANSYARREHLRVGDQIPLVVLDDALEAKLGNASSESAVKAVLRDAPASQRATVRVDGIGVSIDDIVFDPGYEPSSINLTPAFFRIHHDPTAGYWGAAVILRPGATVEQVTAEAQRLVPGEPLSIERASAVTAEVDDATRPQVIALEVFAVLAALTGVVVIGQTMSRRMQLDGRDNPTLAAIGTTRPQRTAVSLAWVSVGVVVGAIGAVLIALAVSPLSPVGAVRVAEVHPGVEADWTVLLVGGVAVAVVVMALAALPAWRWSRVGAGRGSVARSRVAAAIATLGGSVVSVIGIRFGLEPESGRTAMPVRTTLLAAATAVALVVAAVVFSSSLDHLVASPRLYGSAWDAQIELDDLSSATNLQSGAQAEQIERAFVTRADGSGAVAASSVLAVGEVRTKSVAVPAIGLSEGRHPVLPTLAAGRLPDTASEIALGETTMARLHTHIGGVVRLALAERGPTRPVRVVGRVVLPGLAPYPGADKAGLGVGALLTEAGWTRFSSDFGKLVYVVRWRPGANDATLNRYIARVDPHDAPVTLTSVYQPAGIRSLVQLRATPTFLAAMLVALLAAAVANSLVVAVRRRRHDLAVLRTLGFTAGQVLRTVLWQASTVAVIALVVGIPVGLVLGRWTWTLLAQLLGTVPEPMIPAAGIVLLAVAVLALTNLVGVIPGIRASRTPGPSLRAE